MPPQDHSKAASGSSSDAQHHPGADISEGLGNMQIGRRGQSSRAPTYRVRWMPPSATTRTATVESVNAPDGQVAQPGAGSGPSVSRTRGLRSGRGTDVDQMSQTEVAGSTYTATDMHELASSSSGLDMNGSRGSGRTSNFASPAMSQSSSTYAASTSSSSPATSFSSTPQSAESPEAYIQSWHPYPQARSYSEQHSRVSRSFSSFQFCFLLVFLPLCSTINVTLIGTCLK
ncbi:hypothetical protein CPB84DRAFT_616341 [Gymnopilus junonius]|uniref:Uncharacterized protein n=1 Tax=Gymnopilus junonius TaxID=109634 RepID=A0A9P5NU30_GYMJU|nr:hypothetical protein CPB84DRAFT_616341 [Gymnopilus junonius]